MLENRQFTDQTLQAAARQTAEAMLSTLPSRQACAHAFSETFLQKIEKLLHRSKRKKTLRAVMRYAAAFFLAVSVTFGVVMAFSPEARASLIQWTHEKYENSILYRFHNEPTKKPLPLYELAWIPEGMEQKQFHYNQFSYGVFYYNDETGQGFSLDYSYMDNGSYSMVTPEEGCTITHIEVNGCPADLYLMPNEQDGNVLVILDEEANIIFEIGGNIDRDSIINIAENIVLSKTTKK